MGGIFGRGTGKDLGNLFLNNLATPLEMITGQNIYDPQLKGKVAQPVSDVQDAVGSVGASVLPGLLNMYAPGAGTALTGVQSILPEMNIKQEFAEGGQIPQNLFTFNGPSHEDGGIPLNDKAEIEKKETVDMNNQYVYSDTLKVPGKDKTFADISKKYKSSPGDDDISKRSKQMMLDRLKEQQEDLKKSTDFDNKFEDFEKRMGGKIQYAEGGIYIKPSKRGTFTAAAKENGMGVQEFASHVLGAKEGTYSPAMIKKANFARNAASWHRNGGSIEQFAAGGYYLPSEALKDGKKVSGHPTVYGGNAGISGRTQYPWGGSTYDPQSEEIDWGTGTSGGSGDQAIQDMVANSDDGITGSSGGFNMSQATPYLNAIGKIAPIAYNLIQGNKPIDYYKAIQNPQYEKAIELASNMRYNADPEIAAANRTFSQAKRAINDYAGGNSAVALGNLYGAQIAANRAKAQAIANKQNMDNQYRAQEAQIRGNLGENYANELRKAFLYKQQADANKNKFKGQAAVDTGELAQTNQQMINQKAQDDLLMKLLISSYGDLGPMASLGKK